jgi:hypothetical protein
MARCTENVLVHFHIDNSGTKPFEIEHGGDYRGAPRHTRFILTATPIDATVNGGRDAPDLYPIITHMGGFGRRRSDHPFSAPRRSLQSRRLHRAAAC